MTKPVFVNSSDLPLLSESDANSKLTLAIAIVVSRSDTTPQRATMLWGDLVRQFSFPCRTGELGLTDYLAASREVRAKEKDGPGWLPAEIIKGGRRVRADIEKIAALVLDFDQGTSRAEIEEVFKDYEYVLHSTYSHSPDKPKWRLILPLERPIKADLQRPLFDHFNDTKFGGALDKACGHDPSRLFYFPACPPDAVSHYIHSHHTGRLLDAEEILGKAAFSPDAAHDEKFPVRKPPKLKLVAGTDSPPSAPDFKRGYSDGERTRELIRRAGWCYARGMPLDGTISKCLDWNQHNTPPLEIDKVVETCKSLEKTHGRKRADALKTCDERIAALNEEYAWVDKPSGIFRFKHNDFIKIGDFRIKWGNVYVATQIDGAPKTVALAEAWLRSGSRREHLGIVYLPGKPAIHEDHINLWKGWGCDPVPGDVGPWNALLDYLFDGDKVARDWFERWIAYPIRHPGTKLFTCVVLWSVRQGVGKTLIVETVGRLYGDNFRTITAVQLHDGRNEWTKGANFVLGEENASSDRRADSNMLKHLITGATLNINPKYLPPFDVKNTLNFVFTSNHPDAFHIEGEDRRFFVWEITRERLDDAFYADFVHWRDKRGGLEALMHHLLHLDLSGFDPNAAAPVTESKRDMIDRSRTDLERWLCEIKESGSAAEIFGREIAPLKQIVRRYSHLTDSHTNTTAVGNALRRIGLGVKRRITVPPRHEVYALCRPEYWNAQPTEEWNAEYLKEPSDHLGMPAS